MSSKPQWISPEERQKSGQAIRKKVARRQNADFSAKKRLTPALTLLERSVKCRVPALIQIKNERMKASAFGYFRGAVPVMAADLATLPDTGILVQLCGDAHVSNLGAYAAEDGRLVFDINDFDETFRGPFEWDLKRMAASLVVAGRESANNETICERAVIRCISSYSERMRAYAPMPLLELVRDQISRLEEIAPVHVALHKAVRATPMHTLEQLTEPVTKPVPGAAQSKADPLASPRRFREQKPILTRISGAKAEAVIASLDAYR